MATKYRSKAKASTSKAEPVAAPATWAHLMRRALEEPGVVNEAFKAFHTYSFGNIMLAWCQIDQRGLELGPIATYEGWQRLGRQVRKGESALILCQPISFKKDNEQTGETEVLRLFRYRKGWFTLAQTDGDPVPMPEPPSWEYRRALAALDVTEAPFTAPATPSADMILPLDGNTLGYYRHKTRTIHLNPVDPNPLHTALHELAHAILHSDSEGRREECHAKEIEAELTAMLVGNALGLGFAEHSREYCQHWLAERDIDAVLTDERSKRIMQAADTLLKAGQPAKAAGEATDAA